VPGQLLETTIGITKQHPRLDARLRRFLVWALLLLTSGFTFLDYWAYSKVEHSDPVTWQRLAAGHGIAPAQYRIGVYYTANFLAHLTHLQFRHIFALSDFLCVGASLAVLFYLLTRTLHFRERDGRTQWTLVLLALLLTQVYLAWTFWFQEPETMPSLAVLAASSLLCSGVVRVPRYMLAISLLLVAVLGATIRVDAVVAFHAGLLFASLATAADAVPLGKLWQIGTSAVALVLALGIEHFLAHTLFPNAVRDADLLQLGGNLHSLMGTTVLLLVLPAWALTVWLAFRRWQQLNGWARGVVLGSLVHFAMFMVFGMADEVRIFLPFTLILVPIASPLLLDWLWGESPLEA
jgi:hypothetical protein